MVERILSVAFPFAPVRDDTAGGAEQVLRLLDRAMATRGVQSFVVAAEGSEVCGTLLPLPLIDSTLDETAQRFVRARCAEMIARAIDEYDIDLVHYHGVDFSSYCAPDVPSLATLHLPLHLYEDAIFREEVTLHCVSRSQFKQAPRVANIAGFIENGVDLTTFAPSNEHDDYALVLGRICPEKGFHHAIEAARIAGVPLLIAGEVFAYREHRDYFERDIESRLDADRRFIGRIGIHAKKQLLARARCLLVPSCIDETSSLVAMEALASGTPVIAFCAGALPELVAHGESGFLVSDAAEMARAIAELDCIDRRACRRIAEQRFDAKRMIDDYFALYERVAHPAMTSSSSITS